MSDFISRDFIKFSSSNPGDGSIVGFYKDEVLRLYNNPDKILEVKRIVNIIKDKKPKKLISFQIKEFNNALALIHPEIKYITYPEEWTYGQKIEALIAILEIQHFLVAHGMILTDAHSYNITYDESGPIYIDFGSISECRKPFFLKWIFWNCFGLRNKDYWKKQLDINIFYLFFICFCASYSREPYQKLINFLRVLKDRRDEKSKIFIQLYDKAKNSKFLNYIVLKNKRNKYFLSLLLGFKSKFVFATDWSTYKQRDQNETDIKKEILLKYLDIYKPDCLYDIASNKGEYTFFAFNEGKIKKAICSDIDQFSIEQIRKRSLEKNYNITTSVLSLLDVDNKLGQFGNYDPSYIRLSSNFCICYALIHHLCFLGNCSIENFAEKIEKTCDKLLLLEFIPAEDQYLRDLTDRIKEKSSYTLENVIIVFKKYFTKEHYVYDSNPWPRVIIKFEK